MPRKNGNGSATKADLEAAVALREAQVSLLTERIAELEIALDRDGWQAVGDGDDRELSREGLRRIGRLARLAYLKNPLVRRLVDVQALYVWALGWNAQARDPRVNAVVQAFLDDPKNRAELTSQRARLDREIDLAVSGNVFLAFFVDPANGRTRVRTIPVDEVEEIICNPEDRQDPWYYRRVWTQRGDVAAGQDRAEPRVAYYPDWRYTPPERDRPDRIDGHPVRWDVPVCHLKVGGLSGMRFGVPEVYPALDWARAVKEDLEDYATVKRALARFAWHLTVRGDRNARAAARVRLGTTLGADPSGGETNPPPTVGSVFIGSEAGQLAPLRTTGAQPSPEEGRRLWLMVASAGGVPETFFGDASAGTLATAKSLDRPTELKFRHRQTFWADFWRDLLRFVVERAALAPGGALAGRARLVADVDGELVVELDPDLDWRIDVTFPDLLERDPEQRVRAIVQAATLDGRDPAGTIDDRTLVRLLLETLGATDVDELVDRIAPADGESLIAQRRRRRAETGRSAFGQTSSFGRR